ncbi:MAG: PAS domain S-box protein [Opitutaceae bacterium]|nr:PAS domain S-box protein [Opitutaceae bacterium]
MNDHKKHPDAAGASAAGPGSPPSGSHLHLGTYGPAAAALRQRAEAAYREIAELSPEELKALSPEDSRRFLHELRVHQIELEMQNDELRRAQVELVVSRARYFDLYDLAPAGYCTLSEAGLILQANLCAANLLGTARGSLVKQPISRFIHDEDVDQFHLQRKKLHAAHADSSGLAAKPLACELRIVYHDGTLIWVHLAATTAEDEGGVPTLRLVLSDVTERRLMDAALQESEEQRWAILQTAMAGFWVVDSNGWLLEVNESYCVMSGYSVPELLTKRIADLEAPETAEATADHVQRSLGGERSRFESRHRRKDGSIFDVEVSFQFRPVDGGQLVVFLQDISERRRAEEALSRLSRLAVVVRDTRDAITVQDKDGRLLTWSPGAERIYGWSEAEALRMNVRVRIPPERREAELAKLRELCGAETPEFYRTQRIAKSGAVVAVSIIATALFDQAGQMYAIATTERVIAGGAA